MIIEIIIFLAIAAIFVIFARHLPEIKEKKVFFWNKPNKITSEEKDTNHTIKLDDQDKPFWNKTKEEKQLDEANDYLKNKKYDEAEKIYLELASLYPDKQTIYEKLGLLYLEISNFNDAKSAFGELLKLDKKNGQNWYNLALAQIGLKEYRSAINSLVEAVKLQKDNTKYLEVLKDVRGRLKKIRPIGPEVRRKQGIEK